jgi:hypothetical protein
MTLFDSIHREPDAGARPADRPFEYLNRSGRREAECVRETLETYFERYPAVVRDELRARVRREADFDTAVFELIVHEWCLRVGMTIVAVEPAVPGTDRKPDFLVAVPDGRRFYPEATVARGVSDEEASARRRVADVLDAVSRLDSPNFLIHVRRRGTPAQQVNLNKFVADVSQWLASLDHAIVSEALVNGASEPIRIVLLHGMRLILNATPRGLTRGSRDRRAIGSIMSHVEEVTTERAVWNSLDSKARRYGKPDLPLVVAVNVADLHARREHTLDALFGSEVTVVEADVAPQIKRRPDGVWHERGGPRRTQLSAVLAVDNLSPWDLAGRAARLIMNPWAARPIDGINFGVDVLRVSDRAFWCTHGSSLRQVLDLPVGWPGACGSRPSGRPGLRIPLAPGL